MIHGNGEVVDDDDGGDDDDDDGDGDGDDGDDGGDDDEDIAETKDVHCSTSGWPVNWREWPTVTPQNSVEIHSSVPPLFTVCSKT